MPLEYIKTTLFTFTIVLLLFQFFYKRSEKKKYSLFLFSSILITFLFILLIIVKLHHLLREMFGIPNTLTYALISVPIVYHFYRFKSTIFNSNYLVLLISLGFIGVGLVIDLLTDGKIITFASSDFVEEIFRILGALFWLLYYIFYSFRLNRN